MNRVYFATSDEESGAGPIAPRVCVAVEMAGGQARAFFDRKPVGEAIKRSEMLRGFERALPDGSALRVQAFPTPIPLPPPEPATPAPDGTLEARLAAMANAAARSAPPGVTAPARPQAKPNAKSSEAKPESGPPGALDSLPLFSPPTFEPYRVRAWIDSRELREVIGHRDQGDGRVALALLLLVGLIETIIGARLFLAAGFLGFTRFLFTGPVFLLGAVGVWKKWSPLVSLALVVAVADTLILLSKASQEGVAGAFALSIAARVALGVALWRWRRG